jgi:hypothetical protein
MVVRVDVGGPRSSVYCSGFTTCIRCIGWYRLTWYKDECTLGICSVEEQVFFILPARRREGRRADGPSLPSREKRSGVGDCGCVDWKIKGGTLAAPPSDAVKLSRMRTCEGLGSFRRLQSGTSRGMSHHHGTWPANVCPRTRCLKQMTPWMGATPWESDETVTCRKDLSPSGDRDISFVEGRKGGGA